MARTIQPPVQVGFSPQFHLFIPGIALVTDLLFSTAFSWRVDGLYFKPDIGVSWQSAPCRSENAQATSFVIPGLKQNNRHNCVSRYFSLDKMFSLSHSLTAQSKKIWVFVFHKLQKCRATQRKLNLSVFLSGSGIKVHDI